MPSLVFDIETNGLLDTMDRVHCIVIQDVESGERATYRSDAGNLTLALKRLAEADALIGHNIMAFDIPAIQLVFKHWQPSGKLIDTLVLSRLIWPEIAETDFKLARAGKFPAHMAGRHGLEAWGHRLGFHKGDYAKEMKAQGLDPWAAVNDAMVAYCENDVALNVRLYQKIKEKNPSQQAADLEHAVWNFCLQQERFGCSFDEKAAAELYASLGSDRAKIERELKAAFGIWAISRGPGVVKRTEARFTKDPNGADYSKKHKAQGYFNYRVAGAEYTEIEIVEFNPSSRTQIANRLKEKYGWQPAAFTPAGAPIVDEETLKGLRYSEAKLLVDYLTIEKRIGQIAEGANAWLRLCKNGRIHGQLNTNGAVTGRATHSRPNLAQVPKVKKNKEGLLLGKLGGWGHECRSLFRATPGWMLVGADASGLERKRPATPPTR